MLGVHRGTAEGRARLPNGKRRWKMLVVESGGPTMFAGIGIMRALNAGNAMPVPTRRKAAKKYSIVI
jgi:hypothetical protein